MIAEKAVLGSMLKENYLITGFRFGGFPICRTRSIK